jgi:hypothetical protein
LPLSDNPIDRDRRSHHQPIHRTFSARKMLADHMGIDLPGYVLQRNANAFKASFRVLTDSPETPETAPPQQSSSLWDVSAFGNE